MQAKVAPHRAVPPPILRPSAAVIQRRGYTDTELGAFLDANKKGNDETVDAHVTRITTLFKNTRQYAQRSDIVELRRRAWKARLPMASYPAVIAMPLANDFDDHVLGNMAGVGWHSENVRKKNGGTYDYAGKTVLAKNKGTYFASQVKIANTLKAGNNGRSTFFDPKWKIARIRSEATYVANTYGQVGQIIRGRSPSGVMIDCLISNNKVASAYPYKPGW